MLFKAKLFSLVVYFTFLVFYLLKFNSVKTELLYYLGASWKASLPYLNLQKQEKDTFNQPMLRIIV